MTKWDYNIALMSLLLLFFLLWKEVKRKNKRWLFWRLPATILSIVSLTFLAIPLYYNKVIQDVSSHEAILLTEGYNADSLNRFLENGGKGLPVFNVGRSVEFAGNPASQYIPDVRLLNDKSIRAYHVFGYGFSGEEWNAFPPADVVFHSSFPPSGITAIHWNQSCKKGEPLTIRGNCKNGSTGKYKLILTSFAQTLDSTFILPDKSETFTLTTIPKTAGRQTYQLFVLSGRDTIEKELVAVQAEEGSRLKILMLSSSPDFDTKFLKNTLSGEGFEVAARTTISKNKYAYDYANSEAVPLENITSSLADKFDIIIADASELLHLPGAQLSVIKAAVSQKGKGLVIKADSLSNSSFYADLFPTLGTGDSAQQIKLWLPDTSQKLSLTVDYPLSIRSANSNQPLVQDAKNKVYASSALYGLGKMVITTLPNSYTWALSGNEEGYRRFWSTLLNKAAGAPVTGESWTVSPMLPKVNEAVQIQLQTDRTDRIPQGMVNGTPVYLRNNPSLLYQWQGTYWPRRAGWQIGTSTEGKPFYWYAYSPDDWQNVRASQKIIATQEYILSHLYRAEKGRTNLTEKTEIPKLYFFLLFLISAGFLWAEGKDLFASKS